MSETNTMALPELGQIDPRSLSPDVPIQWRDWPPEARPYQTVEEEYVRAPRPVTLLVLRARWQGLYDEGDLQRLCETVEWKLARFRYQDEIAKNALQTSVAGDVEWQRRRIDQEIIDLVQLIENVQGEIDSAYEYAPSKNAGPLGYVKRPMSVDSKSKLIGKRVELSNTLATRLGLASQIVQVNVREETLEQRLKRFMEEHDVEYAQLAQRVAGALPAGTLPAGEGEGRHAHARAEREYSRVIDVTPLPRIEQ